MYYSATLFLLVLFVVGIFPSHGSDIKNLRKLFYSTYATDYDIVHEMKENKVNIHTQIDNVDITGEILGVHKKGEFTLRDGYVELSEASLLHLAAVTNRVEVIEELVKQGLLVDQTCAMEGDLSFHDLTPLHLASYLGIYPVVDWLIPLGADVNAVATPVSFTPLIFAADRGHNDIVKTLLKAGAKVDPFTNPTEQSALHYAVYRNNIELVNILLDAGANVNFQSHDQEGDTSLHMAASAGNVELVHLLISRGADASIVSKDHVTILSLAKESGNKQVISAVESSLKSGPQITYVPPPPPSEVEEVDWDAFPFDTDALPTPPSPPLHEEYDGYEGYEDHEHHEDHAGYEDHEHHQHHEDHAGYEDHEHHEEL